MTLHTSGGDKDFSRLTPDVYQEELGEVFTDFLSTPLQSPDLQAYSISLGFPLLHEMHITFSQSSEDSYNRNIGLGFSIWKKDFARINEISVGITKKYDTLFSGLTWGILGTMQTEVTNTGGLQPVLAPKIYNGKLRGMFHWGNLTIDSESPLEFIRFLTHELIMSGHKATAPLGYRSHNLVHGSTPRNSPIERPTRTASLLRQRSVVPGEEISDSTKILLAKLLK